MLPLILAPNPILRGQAAAIALPVSHDVRTLAQEMIVAMGHYHGIGLAAPQVNVSQRLIVISTSGHASAFINPEIIKNSWHKVTQEEGCLSIPGVFGMVRRPQSVLARYVDLTGTTQEHWLRGILARVYQHEVDHLNGVLFTDRTNKLTAGRDLLATYGLS